MRSTSAKIFIPCLVDAFLLCFATLLAGVLGECNVTLGRSYVDAMGVLSIITLCFFASILIVEIISVFKISDSTFHTVFIAASLLGFVLFSPDFISYLFLRGVTVNIQAFDCLNFAFFALLTLSIIYFWDFTYKLGGNRRFAVLTIAFATACVALHIGLSFKDLQIVAVAIYGAFILAAFVAVCVNVFRHGKDDVPFYTTSWLFSAVLGNCLVCTLGELKLIKLIPIGFTSFYSVIYIALFGLTYVAFAMRRDREALKATEYKLKYERVRSDALRDQIKPHYIFNSLAAIQSLYRKSFELGDRATSLFSKHLRANVEAGNVDLIPFEREVDNIEAYVELENMCYDRHFNVIYDIDFTDFDIPVLSLQPYIENAMRYSKVNEKQDGYIKISVQTENDVAIVEISDNGVGFDVKSVPASSCGIRNSRERFETLMGVTPKIVSAPSQGTVVTIEIPIKSEDKDEDNNR